MRALAHRRFLKMNGLGNEIIVARPARHAPIGSAPAEARAIAAEPRSRFDQLMVAARSAHARHRRLMRDLQHRRLGIRRLRQRHALRRLGDAAAETGQRETLVLETAGRHPALPTRDGDGSFTVDMGAPRFALGRDPAGASRSRHPRDRTQIGPIERRFCIRPSAVNMGNPHAIFWVDDVAGLRSRRDRPAARTPSDLPRARQYLARRRSTAPRAHRPARLGARRRPDPRLRLGRLRRRSSPPRARSSPDARARVSLPGGDLTSTGAKRRPRADDRPGRARIEGVLRAGACSPRAA